jgi:serine/threonine protein kinase
MFFIVYSFGMIIYELLTLSKPYAGDTLINISSNILSGKVPELPQELSPVYEPIKTLYYKSTIFDPDARPSMAELLEEIKNLPFIENPYAHMFM